jgi:3-oxoadipate enol-lactonase
MQVRGVDLAVSAQGTGLPFLWGHGLMGSMAQDDAADLLEWDVIAQATRLLRYDARGHGRSEATLDPGDYRWSEMASDVWSLADAYAARVAVVGGLSMGCATALHAAAAAPERVAGLVLVAPPTAWDTRPRQARIYRGMAKIIESFGLAPLRYAALLARLIPTPDYLAKLRDSVTGSLVRSDARVVVAALRGAADSDLPSPSTLAALDAPALILAWRGDSAHPLSTADALADALPHADLRIAASLEEVGAWSLTIRDFVSGLEVPRPVATTRPA